METTAHHPLRNRRPRKARLLLPLLLQPALAGCLPSSVPAECYPEYAQPYADHINSTAEENNIPPRVAAAITHTEGYRGAPGPFGEHGIFQLMPDTAHEMCSRLGIIMCNPQDSHTNIRLGLGYYRFMLDLGGGYTDAARKYNGGPLGNQNAATLLYAERFEANLDLVDRCIQKHEEARKEASQLSSVSYDESISLFNSHTHTVASGETLSQIATRYSVDMNTLARQNNITNPHWIYAGQVLVIPR